jgi:hypothetical protein
MLLSAAVALGSPLVVWADTVHDEQAWANLTVQGPISDDLLYFAEVQPRFSDGGSRLDQLILRPAIGWRFSPDVTVYQGYARVTSRPEGRPNINEDRSFQQLSWIVSRPWGGEVSSRTRMEQRWRSDGGDVGWRFREMLRLEAPLRPGGKVAALGYAEAFFALNDTDWGADGGFDQLRSFVGAEIGVGGRSSVELGYLNQLINQPAGRTRMNHVLSIALFVRH